jgi:hypothetical protein
MNSMATSSGGTTRTGRRASVRLAAISSSSSPFRSCETETWKIAAPRSSVVWLNEDPSWSPLKARLTVTPAAGSPSPSRTRVRMLRIPALSITTRASGSNTASMARASSIAAAGADGAASRAGTSPERVDVGGELRGRAQRSTAATMGSVAPTRRRSSISVAVGSKLRHRRRTSAASSVSLSSPKTSWRSRPAFVSGSSAAGS